MDRGWCYSKVVATEPKKIQTNGWVFGFLMKGFGRLRWNLKQETYLSDVIQSLSRKHVLEKSSGKCN
jgi:carbohydrate-selective porin OprB